MRSLAHSSMDSGIKVTKCIYSSIVLKHFFAIFVLKYLHFMPLFTFYSSTFRIISAFTFYALNWFDSYTFVQLIKQSLEIRTFNCNAVF